MPINSYIRPQSEIYQQLAVTINQTRGYLAACLYGPQYDLYRYNFEELPAHKFTTEEQNIPYEYAQDPILDYVVDQNSVMVYAEGLQASLATFENKVKVDDDSLFILRLTDGLFASTTGNKLATELGAYGVQIGDLIAVEQDGETRVRQIVDIVGKKTDAEVSTYSVATSTGNGKLTLVSEATDYIGTTDTTYLLSVESVSDSSVKLKISDTASVDAAADAFTVTSETNEEGFAVGTLGVKVKLSDFETLAVGDIYSVSCVASAASTTEFDGVLLDAMPVSAATDLGTTLAKAELRKAFSGQLTVNNGVTNPPYIVDAAGVHVQKNLGVLISDMGTYKPFVDGVGELFVQFRVLILPDEDEEVIQINSLADIHTYLGTVSQMNPVAYAAEVCLNGSAGRGIYVLRTRGTDKEAFLAAAKKTETDSRMYSHVPLTADLDICKAVIAYNETLCAPDVKKFRRTVIGAEIPEEYVVAARDGKGQQIVATFTSASGSSNATHDNIIVQIDDDIQIDLKDISYNGAATQIRPGDWVELSVNGKRYQVKKLLSSRELQLVSGPPTEIKDAPVAIKFIKTGSAANLTEYVQGVCAGINNRRATVVFCDEGKRDGEIVSNIFLAAYVAGLSSSVLPQQSITRSEVSALDSCAKMYTKYTRQQLDEIARYGCLVIVQDTKNSPCYVRHQLTTETDKGILYYEESCTRNYDNICFGIEDVIGDFAGKANITPTTMQVLTNDIRSCLDRYTNDSTNNLIGASLVSYDGLTIQQDPTFMDRIIVNVNLGLPSPMNNIKFYSYASVAVVTM